MFFLKIREKILASRISSVEEALKELSLKSKEINTHESKERESIKQFGKNIRDNINTFQCNMTMFSSNLEKSVPKKISAFFKSFFCPNSPEGQARRNASNAVKNATNNFNSLGKIVRKLTGY